MQREQSSVVSAADYLLSQKKQKQWLIIVINNWSVLYLDNNPPYI